LIQWSFCEWDRLLSPGCCCCCCCGGGGPDPQFGRWSLWLQEAIGFKQMVIWDKGHMGMGWHYRRSYETVLGKTDHPTEKPVELAEHFIQLHTQRGQLVLDPFLGSGSTALACAKLGRKFIGVDIDEEHIKTTVLRLKNYDGAGMLMDLMKFKKAGGRTRK
jgi:DNA modification methylase